MWFRKDVTYTGDLNEKIEIPKFEEATHSNKKVWKYWLGATVVVALILTVIVLFMGDAFSISVYDGEIRVTGASGFSLPVARTTCTLLPDDLPTLDGYTGTGVLLGTHAFSNGTQARFAIHTGAAPIIKLTYDAKDYYVNLTTAEETQKLYDLIIKSAEEERLREGA